MHSSYQTNTQPGDLSLPLVVDAGLLSKIITTLRRSPERMRCFWCHEPLTGPTCQTCDAESAS